MTSRATTSAVVAASGLTRHYKRGAEIVRALDGVDLELDAGRLVALVGPSGSGKTTLMNLIGCLDQPTKGEIRLRGERVDNLSTRALTRIRRRSIGFIFQNFYLLPELSARDNVTMPMVFDRRRDRATRAQALLERVGLAKRQDHLPSELSGGEMQRVAIARALANDPAVVLADEPTGKLDSVNGQAIADLFTELTATGVTILMATHDPQLAEQADEIIRLKDGARI